MNFLKQTIEWSNTATVLMKSCAVCCGIAGGVLFHSAPGAFLSFFLVVSLLTATTGIVCWLQRRHP